MLQSVPQCLNIIEKVSFYIASEASYVYILNGQKFIKNAKNGPFWKLEDYDQTVLPEDRSLLMRQKMVESAKIERRKWDILGDFQTLCNARFARF